MPSKRQKRDLKGVKIEEKKKGGEMEKKNEKKRPQIQYPCHWEYTIIGTDREKMRKAVQECIDNQECEVKDSKQHGKYFSQKFKAYVESEEERNRFFANLQNHKDIKFVL
jgi:putative lipoic acid-binding regulatory protein